MRSVGQPLWSANAASEPIMGHRADAEPPFRHGTARARPTIGLQRLRRVGERYAWCSLLRVILRAASRGISPSPLVRLRSRLAGRSGCLAEDLLLAPAGSRRR